MHSIAMIRRGAMALLVVTPLITSQLAAQEGFRNARSGFWWGLGLGFGSTQAECQSCNGDRTSGPGFNLHMGGTLSPSFLLGGEINAFAIDANGNIKHSMGAAALTVTWYPSRTGAFYLKAGLGAMTYTIENNNTGDEIKAEAPVATLGLGYEFRVRRNLSLTPYFTVVGSSAVELEFNGAPVASEDIKINLATFGMALTWH